MNEQAVYIRIKAEIVYPPHFPCFSIQCLWLILKLITFWQNSSQHGLYGTTPFYHRRYTRLKSLLRQVLLNKALLILPHIANFLPLLSPFLFSHAVQSVSHFQLLLQESWQPMWSSGGSSGGQRRGGGGMVFVWLGKRTLFWQIGVPPWRLGSSGRHLLSVSIWGMLAPESLWSKACMVAEMGTLYTMLQVMTACTVCVYSVYSKRGIFLCFCLLQLNTVVIIVFGQ